MNAHRRVLVVSCHDDRRETLRRWLTAAGHIVHACDSFQTGREALETLNADLLITDVRLKVFNGLHLIIWSRCRDLCSRTVLIGDPDPVLQKEAEREHATYVTMPLDESALLDVVTRTLSGSRSARRYPRVPVALPARINGIEATVTDVSYDGVRIELRNAAGLVLPEYFTVSVGEPGRTYRLQRVWWRRAHGHAEVLLCGSKLPGVEPPVAWRNLVDAAAADSIVATPMVVGGSSL